MAHKTTVNGKTRWEVRLRAGRRGSKSVRRRFLRKEDAERFEIELRRKKQRGEVVSVVASKQTLDEFAAEWWEGAERRLALTTRNNYSGALRRYVLPRLGDVRLSGLNAPTVNKFKSDLLADGKGFATVRYAGQVLSAICAEAVLHGVLDTNPCHAVTWPSPARQRAVRPFAPRDVEKLRREMPTTRDAALISLLAYAGLRPQEALALTWDDLRAPILIIDKAVTYGVIKPTKNTKNRWVAVLKPLADDLRAYRKAQSAIPGPGAFMFPHPLDPSRPWGDTTYRNWSRRVFAQAAEDVGIDAVPYDLRHSFVSLLLAAGQRPAEVAQQAGHTVAVMEATYHHVIEEFRGMPMTDPAKAIRNARVSPVRHRRARAS